MCLRDVSKIPVKVQSLLGSNIGEDRREERKGEKINVGEGKEVKKQGEVRGGTEEKEERGTKEGKEWRKNCEFSRCVQTWRAALHSKS